MQIGTSIGKFIAVKNRSKPLKNSCGDFNNSLRTLARQDSPNQHVPRVKFRAPFARGLSLNHGFCS